MDKPRGKEYPKHYYNNQARFIMYAIKKASEEIEFKEGSTNFLSIQEIKCEWCSNTSLCIQIEYTSGKFGELPQSIIKFQDPSFTLGSAHSGYVQCNHDDCPTWRKE